MAVKKIDVAGLGMIHLYKRRHAKSMRLSVTHAGNIRVSLPYWVPYRLGVEFAQKRSVWLNDHRPVQSSLQSGKQIGKAHRLIFIAEARLRIGTRLSRDGEIKILYPDTLSIEDSAVQQAAERASIRALKLQAETLLPQRLRILAQQNGFTYSTVSIKRLSSRWGSCSSDHHITLNCYLMQLPWNLIDYVLLHELTHTRVMAHGPAFWSELGKSLNDIPLIKKEMRKYQPKLFTHQAR